MHHQPTQHFTPDNKHYIQRSHSLVARGTVHLLLDQILLTLILFSPRSTQYMVMELYYTKNALSLRMFEPVSFIVTVITMFNIRSVYTVMERSIEQKPLYTMTSSLNPSSPYQASFSPSCLERDSATVMSFYMV